MIFRKNTIKTLIEIEKIFRKHTANSIYFGGFAAKLYGCKRKLADIDVYVDEVKVDLLADIFDKRIIFGPGLYKDRNWISYMFTMNYKGQIVDVCGKKSIRIFDVKHKKWVKPPTGEKHSFIDFNGARIKVVAKESLIKYKLQLHRRVDLSDVKQLQDVK